MPNDRAFGEIFHGRIKPESGMQESKGTLSFGVFKPPRVFATLVKTLGPPRLAWHYRILASRGTNSPAVRQALISASTSLLFFLTLLSSR
jgi:hypothetical protein